MPGVRERLVTGGNGRVFQTEKSHCGYGRFLAR